jgi:lysozyme
MVTLKSTLMRHEGLRLKLYNDSLGVPTIGCGRNLRDRGITESEAHYLLDNDIRRVKAECVSLKLMQTLNAARKDVIHNMVFNLGLTGFMKFKRTIAAIESGDYEAAAKHMLQSAWAKQVGRRSTELAEMMRTGKS